MSLKLRESAENQIKGLCIELDNCSTPYHIRMVINKDSYFVSGKCLAKIRDRIAHLVKESVNVYDAELFEDMFDEIDEKIEQIKLKQIVINAMPLEKRYKKVYYPINMSNKITLDIDPDLDSNVLEAVCRHLFIQTYNLFGGSPKKIANYLGISIRCVSTWKRKYIKKLH